MGQHCGRRTTHGLLQDLKVPLGQSSVGAILRQYQGPYHVARQHVNIFFVFILCFLDSGLPQIDNFKIP